MKKIALTLSLLGLLAGSSDVALSQTQTELTEQACAEYKQADDKLNRVYKSVMERHQGDEVYQYLQEAQIAWLKYRDAQMKALFPPREDMQTEYGSAYSMCHCGEMTALTQARTKALEAWLNPEEGDVCGGSRF